MSALFPVLRGVDVVARDAGGAIGSCPLDEEGGIVCRRWKGKDGAGADIRPLSFLSDKEEPSGRRRI